MFSGPGPGFIGRIIHLAVGDGGLLLRQFVRQPGFLGKQFGFFSEQSLQRQQQPRLERYRSHGAS